MRKEIVLPPHLYDRIKASAGEHGGIGFGDLFTEGGEPLCAHGHAWGTIGRYHAENIRTAFGPFVLESELLRYLTATQNDEAVAPWWTRALGTLLNREPEQHRIPFKAWCRRLNVKRGKDEDYVTASPAEEKQTVQS